MASALVLVITPAPGTLGVRVPLAKRITSIGADQQADVRLATAPSHWLLVEKDGDAIRVRAVEDGSSVELSVGQSVSIGEATVALAAAEQGLSEASVGELAAELGAAGSADDAIEKLLITVMDASSATTGAVILSEDGAFRVACARDENGEVLGSAAELLSDTIVRDVLGTGQRLRLTDVAENARYAAVASVAAMKLRSILCLPIGAGGAPLGALFLGKKNILEPFSEELARDLRMVAALAVPFLSTLRTSVSRAAAAADSLVGDSESMKKVVSLIGRVGPSDLSVLVAGESGTGKELVARAIHAASPRRDKPMIAINCAAVPESLLAAELFGYQKGAFSGAVTDREGLVEAANGSTLFLDEVGDMPLPMQASLLRVLEQREVTRLGENQPRPVDFRLVCATHRDLDQEVASGRMRQDLVFRLRELTLDLPPLRERGADVVLLANTFLRQTELALALPMHTLSEEAQQALLTHNFPGNIRELKATIRRAAIMADSRTIGPASLGLRGGASASSSLGDLSRPLADARDDFVRRYVAAVLERCGGDREATARELRIGVRSLYRYLN